MGAARKPRRALPHRLSHGETGAGASHHDDVEGGPRDCCVTFGARSGANRPADRCLTGMPTLPTPASLLNPEAFLSPPPIPDPVPPAPDEALRLPAPTTPLPPPPSPPHP